MQVSVGIDLGCSQWTWALCSKGSVRTGFIPAEVILTESGLRAAEDHPSNYQTSARRINARDSLTQRCIDFLRFNMTHLIRLTTESAHSALPLSSLPIELQLRLLPPTIFDALRLTLSSFTSLKESGYLDLLPYEIIGDDWDSCIVVVSILYCCLQLSSILNRLRMFTARRSESNRRDSCKCFLLGCALTL